MAWLKYAAIVNPIRQDIISYRQWLTVEHDAIQLDPVTISTISGQTNNVWADAGDVTVEFAADVKTYIDNKIAELQAQIGDKKVLLALSGGVDSSVVAALLIKAIGKNLVCVHVNHGLLRKGEPEAGRRNRDRLHKS